MILYLQATTNVQDLVIDYIEVKLKSGKTASLNWDESGINRSETGFDARYKGVYFDEEYANGKISELDGMKIDTSADRSVFGKRISKSVTNHAHFVFAFEMIANNLVRFFAIIVISIYKCKRCIYLIFDTVYRVSRTPRFFSAAGYRYTVGQIT